MGVELGAGAWREEFDLDLEKEASLAAASGGRRSGGADDDLQKTSDERSFKFRVGGLAGPDGPRGLH